MLTRKPAAPEPTVHITGRGDVTLLPQLGGGRVRSMPRLGRRDGREEADYVALPDPDRFVTPDDEGRPVGMNRACRECGHVGGSVSCWACGEEG